ncbi:MAG: cation:proton antiporter [Bacteroidaceae bacterium]|nr:cation:proton antiporter [Bacteroidaceae bacterium]
MEEANLVKDLALILISAGVFTIISKALKQPLILGYIVAGFLVGPHMGLFPTVTSTAEVKEWSDIGIIFLLFALGLEFSFKKLIKVGSSALITAITQCVGMFILGFLVGEAIGWSNMESIFLGGMLSMSSTTIIIKAYDDLGYKDRPFAPLVFGALVFEDLIAVVLMVLLSTMAVSNKFAGGEMLMGLAKLVFFLILWFLVGIYMIPTILKKAHKYLNDEILLLVSLGLCFVMVSLASVAGFSEALGAFVMGSILAETLESEHIMHLTKGIKDLFGAIFFVSVGMMVDPHVIAEHWGTILVLTITVMAGILFFSTSGAVLAGQGLDNAVHAGFSLAQLGEFSFIIAGLGVSLGVMRDFIYPVIITVSVITTFTTPYMIKAGTPAYQYLIKKLPEQFVAKINSFSSQERNNTAAAQNEWKRLIKEVSLRVLLYGVILIAIDLGSHLFLDKVIISRLDGFTPFVRNLISVVITLVVMSPFLVGIAISGDEINRSSIKLIKARQANVWPVISLALLRILIAMGFVLSVIATHFNLAFWTFLLILISGVAFFFIGRRSISKFTIVEDRFMANLNEKEQQQRRMAPVTSSVSDKMSRYNVKTDMITISADSLYAGKMLKDLPFRHKSGVNIVKIIRGSRSIMIPKGDEVVFPFDKLLAVGTKEQLAEFRKDMAENVYVPEEADAETLAPRQFELESITLKEDSWLTGKTLRETDMRSYGCMVISVVSDGQVTTNPKPDYRFKEGDIVWLAGEKSACDWWA